MAIGRPFPGGTTTGGPIPPFGGRFKMPSPTSPIAPSLPVRQQPGINPPNTLPWEQNLGTLETWGANNDLLRILQGTYVPHQFPEHERTRQPAFLQGQLSPYIGQATLTQLLLGQGKTDPQAFSRQLSGISQNTGALQGQVQGTLAQRGLGSSGIGQALGAAVGQAGSAQIAGARANEAALAEQRKRQDLDLLLRVFMDPYAAYENNALQQYLGERQTQGRSTAAALGALGSILGGAAQGGWQFGGS